MSLKLGAHVTEGAELCIGKSIVIREKTARIHELVNCLIAGGYCEKGYYRFKGLLYCTVWIKLS